MTFAPILMLLISTSSPIKFSKIHLKDIKEASNREIGYRGDFEVSVIPTEAQFNSCVPRESMPFPKQLTPEIEKKIFVGKELKDLMACSPTGCAFNFSAEETQKLSNSKTEQERKNLYFSFYQNRSLGKTAPAPDRASFFIASDQIDFGPCGQHSRFKDLLTKRPDPKASQRLSLVRYSDLMRPTSRLLQGASWKQNQSLCYAETLLFADHYDLERVELWSLHPIKDPDYSARIELHIRHRIDLLNSWVRRLNKPAFVKELKKLMESQLTDVQQCLKTTKP